MDILDFKKTLVDSNSFDISKSLCQFFFRFLWDLVYLVSMFCQFIINFVKNLDFNRFRKVFKFILRIWKNSKWLMTVKGYFD